MSCFTFVVVLVVFTSLPTCPIYFGRIEPKFRMLKFLFTVKPSMDLHHYLTLNKLLNRLALSPRNLF